MARQVRPELFDHARDFVAQTLGRVGGERSLGNMGVGAANPTVGETRSDPSRSEALLGGIDHFHLTAQRGIKVINESYLGDGDGPHEASFPAIGGGHLAGLVSDYAAIG